MDNLTSNKNNSTGESLFLKDYQNEIDFILYFMGLIVSVLIMICNGLTSVVLLTFSLPYMTEISVVIRQ